MRPSINEKSEKFHCDVCPHFCLLRVRVCLNEANPWLESSMDSIDRGRNFFREDWDHSLVFQDSIKFLERLIMYSFSNAYPPLQMGSWTKRVNILSFVILEKISNFSSFLFDVFWLISCIWSCKYKFCCKNKFSFEYWHRS